MNFPINQDVMRHNLKMITGSLTLPETFIVIDLETTGLDKTQDKIWQFGCFIRDHGFIRYEQGKNWWLQVKRPQIKQADFEINRRANKVRKVPSKSIFKTDKAYKAAETEFIKTIEKKGVGRKETLAAISETLNAYYKAGCPIVGQNFVRFDMPFLQWECKKLSIPFTVPTKNIIDVGLLIKAARLNRKKKESETPRQFYIRIASERAKGVYYAIERFCIPYWQLDKKYGIDITEAHDAGYDCWLTYLILQEILKDVNAHQKR